MKFILHKKIIIKSIFFLSIFLFSSFTCIKKNQGETQNFETDIVYSDSFSPNDWENPAIRRQLVGGDKDIGVFISSDTLDPKIRNISLSIEKFFNALRNQKKDDIKNLLTLSAYNSYLLRYQDLTFDIKFDLRTSLPQDMTINPFWVNFKTIFKDKSIVGKIELTQNGDDYKISDFDEYFFNELKKYINE